MKILNYNFKLQSPIVVEKDYTTEVKRLIKEDEILLAVKTYKDATGKTSRQSINFVKSLKK